MITPERLKKCYSHSERGFLVFGEASAKERVLTNPVTEPKRSQKPKRPLLSIPPPNGYNIFENAPKAFLPQLPPNGRHFKNGHRRRRSGLPGEFTPMAGLAVAQSGTLLCRRLAICGPRTAKRAFNCRALLPQSRDHSAIQQADSLRYGRAGSLRRGVCRPFHFSL